MSDTNDLNKRRDFLRQAVAVGGALPFASGLAAVAVATQAAAQAAAAPVADRS